LQNQNNNKLTTTTTATTTTTTTAQITRTRITASSTLLMNDTNKETKGNTINKTTSVEATA